MREFEIKVVKVGLEDPCEKVRKNMREVLENIEVDLPKSKTLDSSFKEEKDGINLDKIR